MDQDPRAASLLEYLRFRPAVLIHSGEDEVARVLGLTPAEFDAAARELCGRGLALRQEGEGGSYWLGITEAGRGGAAPAGTHRRWWQFWRGRPTE